MSKPIRRQDLVEAARVCLLDKDTRWGTLPPPDEGPISDLSDPATEPEAKHERVAFGRGGLCLFADANLFEGCLVRLVLTAEVDQPVSVVAIVRWIEPRLHLSGLEIRHVEDTGRGSVIRVTDNVPVPAFIPRAVDGQ